MNDREYGVGYFLSKALGYVAPVVLMGAMAVGVSTCIQSEKKRMDEVNPIIERAYEHMAGEDGIITAAEKVRFLKDNGLKSVIDETQKIRLEPMSREVKVFLENPNPPWVYAGSLQIEDLKNYLNK